MDEKILNKISVLFEEVMNNGFLNVSLYRKYVGQLEDIPKNALFMATNKNKPIVGYDINGNQIVYIKNYEKLSAFKVLDYSCDDEEEGTYEKRLELFQKAMDELNRTYRIININID